MWSGVDADLAQVWTVVTRGCDGVLRRLHAVSPSVDISFSDSIGVPWGFSSINRGVSLLRNSSSSPPPPPQLKNIVRDHKDKTLDMPAFGEEDREDLDVVLLRLQKNGDLELPLSDNVVKATLLYIFSAGSDTSSTVMDWVMSELVKNPRVVEKVQIEVRRIFDGKGYVDETSIDELKNLRSVIKETLRVHPPAPLLLPRECSEKCEINGHEIPAKSKVIVNA